MIFVDSSVWIDYFRGTSTIETDHLDALLGEQEVVVGTTVTSTAKSAKSVTTRVNV